MIVWNDRDGLFWLWEAIITDEEDGYFTVEGVEGVLEL